MRTYGLNESSLKAKTVGGAYVEQLVIAAACYSKDWWFDSRSELKINYQTLLG